MLQFPVQKENEHKLFTYTDRVMSVSIDGAHIIYLSQKKHPEEVAHHKMHVSEIQLWPHFDLEYFEGVAEEKNNAMLTFVIYGTELTVNPNDIKRIQGEPAPAPPQEPEGHLETNAKWRLRVPDIGLLREIVTSIRRSPDDAGSSPVALQGSLDNVEQQLKIYKKADQERVV